jgi:hypothetical protein
MSVGSQVMAGKVNNLAYKGMNLGHIRAEKVNVRQLSVLIYMKEKFINSFSLNSSSVVPRVSYTVIWGSELAVRYWPFDEEFLNHCFQNSCTPRTRRQRSS